jgi:hypothetical protein
MKPFNLQKLLFDYYPMGKGEHISEGDILVNNLYASVIAEKTYKDGADLASVLKRMTVTREREPGEKFKFSQLILSRPTILKHILINLNSIGVLVDSSPAFDKMLSAAQEAGLTKGSKTDYLRSLLRFIRDYLLDYSESRYFLSGEPVPAYQQDSRVIYDSKLYNKLAGLFPYNSNKWLEVVDFKKEQRSTNIFGYTGYVVPLSRLLDKKKRNCALDSLITYMINEKLETGVDLRIEFGEYRIDPGVDIKISRLTSKPHISEHKGYKANHAWLEAELNGERYIIDPSTGVNLILKGSADAQRYKDFAPALVLKPLYCEKQDYTNPMGKVLSPL